MSIAVENGWLSKKITFLSGVTVKTSKKDNESIFSEEIINGKKTDVIKGHGLSIKGTDKDDNILVIGDKNEVDGKDGNDSIVFKGKDNIDIQLENKKRAEEQKETDEDPVNPYNPGDPRNLTNPLSPYSGFNSNSPYFNN